MYYLNSEILKRFSIEMQGNFIQRTYWESDKVELKYNSRPIELDNYTEYRTSGNQNFQQNYTRVITPIFNTNNFKFQIYPETILSFISKIFGAQDIIIGDKEFDNTFILKTNDEFKLKAFLSNKNIRKYIHCIKGANLRISDQKGIWGVNLPETEFELSLFVEGLIVEVETLKLIHILFVEMIDQLEQIKAIKPLT